MAKKKEVLTMERSQKPFQPRACDYAVSTHTKVETDRKKAHKQGYRKHKATDY